MKKARLEELLIIADEMCQAAVKASSNQANRDFNQHFNKLIDIALKYSKERYTGPL